jgi:hypothetical protein
MRETPFSATLRAVNSWAQLLFVLLLAVRVPSVATVASAQEATPSATPVPAGTQSLAGALLVTRVRTAYRRRYRLRRSARI